MSAADPLQGRPSAFAQRRNFAPGLSLAETGYDDAAREAAGLATRAKNIVAILLLGAITSAVIGFGTFSFPVIAVRYHTNLANWVPTITFMFGAPFGLLAGKLGDIYGKKKVALMMVGIAFIGAVLSASVHSFVVILIGRVLQAAGPGIAPCLYGLVRDLFPRRSIPVLVGLLAGTFGAGSPLVQNISNQLLADEPTNYERLYWIIAAVILIAGLLGWLLLSESPLRAPFKLDWNSLGLISVGVISLIYGLNEVSVRGWGSWWSMGYMIAGVLLLIAWAFYERTPSQALMSLDLLRSKAVLRTFVAMFVTGVCLYGISQLQNALPNTPRFPMGPGGLDLGYGFGLFGTKTNFLNWPAAGAAVFGGLLGGLLARWRGAYWPMLLGVLCMLGSGAGSFFVTTQHIPLMLGIAGQSLGISLILASVVNLTIEAVPAHSQGVSAGVAQVFQDIGVSLGTQLFTVAILAHYTLSLPGTPFDTSQGGYPLYRHTGLEVGWAVALGVTTLALIIAMVIPHGRVRGSGGALPHAAEVSTAGARV